MVLPLHSFNKYLVSSHSVHSTVLRTVGNTSSFLESAFRKKKLKIKKREKEREGGIKHLGEADNTNLLRCEKCFFGPLFYLETKNLSMTVATFSLPKCQSQLLFCKGQVILYLQSFHRAYAKSAWGRPRTA